jgi:hypothetical protein
VCACTFNKWVYAEGTNWAALRLFDGWGTPLSDAIIPDPDHAAWGLPCVGARLSDRTWAVWYEFGGAGLVWGRIFDPHGEPAGDTFLVSDTTGLIDGHDQLAVGLGPSRAAVVHVTRGHGGGTQGDIYAQLLSADGLAESDLIPVATDSPESEEQVCLAVLNDGAVVVAYEYGGRPGEPRWARLQRIEVDGTVGAPVLVDQAASDVVFVRALADGTLLVAHRRRGAGGAFAQRYDALCQPLGEPGPIDGGFYYAAGASDGRLVLAGPVAGSLAWIRFYDADWQPSSERFNFGPDAWFNTVAPPVAYDDDGTIWVAWQGRDDITFLTSLKPFEPGDMNYDRRVDNFDITPFVMALADPAEYQEHYPGLPYEFLGDVNEDGAFDNFDITPFVHLLTGR